MFDPNYRVHIIDFDCSIFLDPYKDSFKIKGYTEGYASHTHIECFKKGQKLDRDHLE